MRVIVANWYDNYNQPFMTELYDSDIFESEILDFYTEAKDMYGHKILNSSPDTLVFTDGTRVILTYQSVANSVLNSNYPFKSSSTYPNDDLLRLEE